MATIPKELRYATTHEWVRVEGDKAYIGITDFAQSELGDLVYAETEPVGTVVLAGDAVGSVESVKMASDVFTPVSGTIVEIDTDLEDEPERINSEPYDTWIVAVRMSNVSELDDMLDADAYQTFCEDA